MSLPWINENGTETRGTGSDPHRNTGQDDLGMIPWWSVALAIVAFGAMQYLCD